MCGIAGLFTPRGSSAPTFDLEKMLRAMAHRGPDGHERYLAPDGRYAAGFVRLSIIDLETGMQPIEDPVAKRVLTGNGEIYNYLELRARPDCRTYPFRTKGDMESVLALARALGNGFVEPLNGMFALALYDHAQHRLTLVRDRLGIKPLYWARVAGDSILYASEVKALFASGLVAPRINEGAVAAYLAHGYVPAPETLWQGVHKLPPGHLLSAEADGRVAVIPYWKPAPETAGDAPRSADDWRERMTSLLADAVRLQLRSDVPVGALLSGGIDSGLMVALAAQSLSRPLSTFTVRFEGGRVDETPLAGQVAKRYATDHHVLDLKAGDAVHLLPRLAWTAEEPVNDPALIPNFLIEQALAPHVRVVLNGTGGDELFAGYGWHFRKPVEQRYLTLPEGLRTGLIEPVLSRVHPMTAWRLGRARLFVDHRGEYAHRHMTPFPHPIWNAVGCRLPRPLATQTGTYDGTTGEPQARALATDLATYLVNDLLLLLDRTSMAFSVEGRVPFLDHRLVEAALAVPEHIRTPGGRQKGLERQMAAAYLPTDVLAAPKHGFVAPVPAWLAANMASPARRLLQSPRALERGWWSKSGIDMLFADPSRHAWRIYTLMMLELSIRTTIEHTFEQAPAVGLGEMADAA